MQILNISLAGRHEINNSIIQYYRLFGDVAEDIPLEMIEQANQAGLLGFINSWWFLTRQGKTTWIGKREYFYDPKKRAAEKQASRDQDAADLASGKITQEELRNQNGAFAFPNVIIALKDEK